MENVLFVEVEEWEKELLQKNIPKSIHAEFSQKTLEELDKTTLQRIEILSPFIYSKINSIMLQKMPKLKLIATRSTGTDHIDLLACTKRGITVKNVPTYGENTVAEHTFGLILALSRKIYQGIQQAKKGDFSTKRLRGFDLKGKTIGIVGMGNIGKHVARIARGFEMKTIAFDIKKEKALEKKLGLKFVDFDFLLANSDIITLHAPYNKHTHHLINSKNISKIKKSALLINTSRGGLIETAAIIKALDSSILGAVGLDVLEEEALIKEESQLLSEKKKKSLEIVLENHILLGRENVLITPHNAFNSTEAIERIAETTVENIISFQKKN